ncbi:hypothetical protein Bbelb_253340 [Branchiostoma belcheri]|nr:hypothetical protein Bbelb_253340 [Branchiostoma belcheri]
MNMDASPVRGKYKCEIYRLYVQSVIRYLLTVHDVTRTHQQELSHSVTQYLKKRTSMKKHLTRVYSVTVKGQDLHLLNSCTCNSMPTGVFEFVVNGMTNWLPTRTGQPGPLGKGTLNKEAAATKRFGLCGVPAF